MQENVDKSRQEIALEKTINGTEVDFYVVSPKKFITLFVVTFGIYIFYWFYNNWKSYRMASGENIWPVARSLFSIFFAHNLFKKMLAKHNNQTPEMVKRVDMLASVYVLAYIASNVGDRLSAQGIGAPYSDFVSLLLLPVLGWVLYQAQLLANVVCKDPNGDSNNTFTAGNYVCLLLGAAVWGIVLWGLTL